MSPPAPDLKHPEHYNLTSFDEIFLNILHELSADALKGTRECTNAIFNLSSNCIDKPAFDALKSFYDLYFSDGDVEQGKERINQEVGDLVDSLQSRMAAGEDLDQDSVDESFETERLGLAGVQKQLEGLITLDAGLKSRILPALTSIQFEDAVNQRLEHIFQAWRSYADFFARGGPFGENLEDMARELAKVCSSVEECKDFYEIVLKENAPQGQQERGIFLEF